MNIYKIKYNSVHLRKRKFAQKPFKFFCACLLTISIFSCEKNEAEVPELPNAELRSFSFKVNNNSLTLISDLECKILGDSAIECMIPHIVDTKNLVPSFETVNGKLFVDGQEIISDTTELNCAKPLKINLVGTESTKSYSLKVMSFTGLPIAYINTEESKEINSKDEYVHGTLRIVEDINTRGPGDIFESPMRIKGRGNSTWTLPKKPYKMKFDSKTSLLNEPSDKEWVLLANYTDKTAIRNEIAFYMGEMSKLDYTPRTHYVEVMLNGVYNGTYQLCEQLKISKDRVNVGDDGYLLEVDAKAALDDITFNVSHISYPINIKDPDVEVGSEAYNYVSQYLQNTVDALFSDNFADETDGYAKYIDTESFVDWYLINEIAKNGDSFFYTSCYMNLTRDGKLKMGPLWDFDIAFGNVNYGDCGDPEGLIYNWAELYTRLFQDPNFVAKVKERFKFFYSKREDIYNEINANATYLKYSTIENNNKWHTLYTSTWPNKEIWGSYENEVQSLKQWLEKRFQWLYTKYASM